VIASERHIEAKHKLSTLVEQAVPEFFGLPLPGTLNLIHLPASWQG